MTVMSDNKDLSSLEKLLLGIDQPINKITVAPLRRGGNCPLCGEGELDYNGLLQLECSTCGFVDSDGGGCT